MNKFKNITTSLFLVIGILIVTFLGIIAIDPKNENEIVSLSYINQIWYTSGDSVEGEIGNIEIEINWEDETYRYDYNQNYNIYKKHSSGYSYTQGEKYLETDEVNYVDSNGWKHSNGYDNVSEISVPSIDYIDFNKDGYYNDIKEYEYGKKSFNTIEIDWRTHNVSYGDYVVN